MNDSEATSISLIDRVKARDPDAWQKLRDLYAPLVVQWCRWAGAKDDDIPDIGQDVFLAVAKGIASFEKSDAQHSFRGWLRTIAQHKTIDYLRRRQRQPSAEGGTDAQLFIAHVPDNVSDGTSPRLSEETALLYRRAMEIVAASFPPWYREAFWSVVVENQSPSATAERLQVRVSAVYTAKARILRRLREEFADILT